MTPRAWEIERRCKGETAIYENDSFVDSSIGLIPLKYSTLQSSTLGVSEYEIQRKTAHWLPCTHSWIKWRIHPEVQHVHQKACWMLNNSTRCMTPSSSDVLVEMTYNSKYFITIYNMTSQRQLKKSNFILRLQRSCKWWFDLLQR